MKELFLISCTLFATSLLSMEIAPKNETAESIKNKISGNINIKEFINRAINRENDTCLHVSARSDQHLDLTKKLLENGARICVNKRNETPLMIAANSLEPESVKTLLAHIENLENKEAILSNTNNVAEHGSALHLSCSAKDGLIINEEKGGTKLDTELCKKRETVVGALLLAKANPNQKNRWGHTPFYRLLNSYPTKCIEDISDEPNLIEDTILYALIPHTKNLLGLFIRFGADLTIQEGDSVKKTAIDSAREKNIFYFMQLADFAETVYNRYKFIGSIQYRKNSCKNSGFAKLPLDIMKIITFYAYPKTTTKYIEKGAIGLANLDLND